MRARAPGSARGTQLRSGMPSAVRSRVTHTHVLVGVQPPTEGTVGQVGQWMTQCAEFPVEHRHDSRLGRVEH